MKPSSICIWKKKNTSAADYLFCLEPCLGAETSEPKIQRQGDENTFQSFAFSSIFIQYLFCRSIYCFAKVIRILTIIVNVFCKTDVIGEKCLMYLLV